MDNRMSSKRLDRSNLPNDVWACPNCSTGFEQYMVNTDRHVCVDCGYKGGPLQAICSEKDVCAIVNS